MTEEKESSVVLRPKRQVTLPKKICDRLGIETGDALELLVKDSVLIARPRKSVSMESLKEIQKAFKSSGITEEALQKAGRRVRQEITKERDGAKV